MSDARHVGALAVESHGPTIPPWDRAPRGSRTAFTTARHKLVVRDTVTAVVPDLVISNGGALARYHEQVLYRRVLDAQAVNSLLVHCIHLGRTSVASDSGYWTNAEQLAPLWTDFDWVIRTDFAKSFAHEAYHVGVTVSDMPKKEALIRTFSYLRAQAFANEDLCAFYHPEATKEQALVAAAAALGISLAEVAAFGDDANDIAMLSACGHGVAVANAIDAAKAAADDVCDDCDEDGVARWIEKHALDGYHISRAVLDSDTKTRSRVGNV